MFTTIGRRFLLERMKHTAQYHFSFSTNQICDGKQHRKKTTSSLSKYTIIIFYYIILTT